MSRALYTAATGMQAQQLRIDVIANNIANVNTTGFKKSRAEFDDLMYQTLRLSGVGSSRETETPAGLQIGLGTRPTATDRSFSQGEMTSTQNQLDVAIEGAGLFQVRLPGGDLAYTRGGTWKLDSRGQIVTAEGYPMEPPVTVPQDTVALTIAADGLVTAVTAERAAPVEIGHVQLANVLNTGSLEAMGKNLYRFNGEPGNVQIGTPGKDGLGTLAQGFLESSNVSVVEEMIAMIVGQRAYEANSKVIQTADRLLEDANRLR